MRDERERRAASHRDLSDYAVLAGVDPHRELDPLVSALAAGVIKRLAGCGGGADPSAESRWESGRPVEPP